MKRSWNTVFGLCLVIFSFACLTKTEQTPTLEFVREFMNWKTSKQIAYFNGIPEESRMKLLVEIIKEKKEFTIGDRLEIKFFPNGEFVYDNITDEGYASNKLMTNDKSTNLIGNWKYAGGVISLSDPDSPIDYFKDDYFWLAVKSRANQDNKISFVLKMDLPGSSDSWEEILTPQNELGSPLINNFSRPQVNP